MFLVSNILRVTLGIEIGGMSNQVFTGAWSDPRLVSSKTVAFVKMQGFVVKARSMVLEEEPPRRKHVGTLGALRRDRLHW